MANTPMMQRYEELKSEVPEHILFFRLGDFYEMFYEDAKLVSQMLGLTLTKRGDVPMCGVPHHAANTYIKRLLDRGKSIAMCEQLTQPVKGKTMVERGIVKIITPGTLIDDEFLSGRQSNFIAAIGNGGISWADISTGEFYSFEVKDQSKYLDIIATINPKEIITKSDIKLDISIRKTDHYDYAFNPMTAYDTILNYFGIKSTKIFDFEMQSPITSSAGALLEYILQTQKQSLKNINKIKIIKNEDVMFLDRTARDNLELTKSFRDGKVFGSLLWVLDETQTPMGARLLSNIVSNPLQDTGRINKRLDAVAALVSDSITCKNLREHLSRLSDLSRMSGRIANRSVTPRDLVALLHSLKKIEEIKNILHVFKEGLLFKTNEDLQTIPKLVQIIDSSIACEPPAKLDNGGYIKDGYNKELDDLRLMSRDGLTWLSRLEEAEREEAKIKEIKIGFNRVTGYYFEIPKRFSKEVPFHLKRIATTTNTERYITDELKQFERKILGAEDASRSLELKLLNGIREETVKHILQIMQNADALAVVDVLCSLAVVASLNRWLCPRITEHGPLDLKDARHPVVEKVLGRGQYIANDCRMDSKKSTMIITGPNMAGKSTYMRSIAICVLMAHIGSFVPCSKADVPIVDRIFTRIGAADSLLTGESTFMVETNEVSRVLHSASQKSLVLIDELGRGTGTQEGRALASAVLTHITNKIGCMTMFATHFHELTGLAKNNSKIENYRATTTVNNDSIVFLHKIEPGIETHSFGLEVAKLAGIPQEIINAAKEIWSLEK